MSYLYGVTSNIQTQINSINVSSILSLNNIFTGTNTFTNTLTLTGNLIVNSTTISPTILSYLSGATSNIQTQISSINTSILLGLNNTWTGSNTFSSNTNTTNLYSNILSINNNNSRRSNNDILEVATSPTSHYLYYNNSSTFGHINTTNSTLSWNITTSGSATIPTINSVTENVGTLNLNNNLIVNSTTISPTVLSYLSGVTSNIQNQISSINTSA